MESKSEKGSSSKKPSKKKQVNPLVEFIDSQVVLFKMCNDLLSRLCTLEIKMEKMTYNNIRLIKENGELKNFFDTLAKKMIDEREGFDMDRKPSFSAEEKTNKKKIKFSKKTPLHDDVTETCGACGRVNHINEKKCSKCGLIK